MPERGLGFWGVTGSGAPTWHAAGTPLLGSGKDKILLLPALFQPVSWSCTGLRLCPRVGGAVESWGPCTLGTLRSWHSDGAADRLSSASLWAVTALFSPQIRSGTPPASPSAWTPVSTAVCSARPLGSWVAVGEGPGSP